MRRLKRFFHNLHPYALCGIAAPLTVAQIILAFLVNHPGSETLRWAGVFLWCMSAVFGWLPILTLRRKGDVPDGKSYVHTQVLVTKSIYAIVRHPQMGTAWFLMCLGLMLITQHWASIALGIPAMAVAYLDLLKADRRLIEKFGDAYREYMATVPRVNFVAGALRLVLLRKSE